MRACIGGASEHEIVYVFIRIYIHTYIHACTYCHLSAHFIFYVFGSGQEMALELVYGADIKSILHHFVGPTGWEGSPALVWPKTGPNRPKLKLQFVA